jgi:hypothetical protein
MLDLLCLDDSHLFWNDHFPHHYLLNDLKAELLTLSTLEWKAWWGHVAEIQGGGGGLGGFFQN